MGAEIIENEILFGLKRLFDHDFSIETSVGNRSGGFYSVEVVEYSNTISLGEVFDFSNASKNFSLSSKFTDDTGFLRAVRGNVEMIIMNAPNKQVGAGSLQIIHQKGSNISSMKGFGRIRIMEADVDRPNTLATINIRDPQLFKFWQVFIKHQGGN